MRRFFESDVHAGGAQRAVLALVEVARSDLAARSPMIVRSLVSLHLICAAAAFLAPAGRQPLLQRRVLLLAAKKKGKGKEAFVPYEISGDSVPMFPLPERRDAIQAHKKFGDKGVLPSKLAPGALDAHCPNLDHAFPGLRVLHLDPPVLTVDGFFSDAECDAYRALEHATETGDAHMLAQSATFSGASDARTSTTWFLRYQAVPKLLAAVSALLGAPLEHFEEPQLVRYQAGQMFSWHYDALPPFHPGGQRAATCLVYLNDVAEGGRTTFRDLRLGGTDAEGRPRRVEVAPKKGRALLFFPRSGLGLGLVLGVRG